MVIRRLIKRFRTRKKTKKEQSTLDSVVHFAGVPNGLNVLGVINLPDGHRLPPLNLVSKKIKDNNKGVSIYPYSSSWDHKNLIVVEFVSDGTPKNLILVFLSPGTIRVLSRQYCTKMYRTSLTRWYATVEMVYDYNDREVKPPYRLKPYLLNYSIPIYEKNLECGTSFRKYNIEIVIADYINVVDKFGSIREAVLTFLLKLLSWFDKWTPIPTLIVFKFLLPVLRWPTSDWWSENVLREIIKWFIKGNIWYWCGALFIFMNGDTEWLYIFWSCVRAIIRRPKLLFWLVTFGLLWWLNGFEVIFTFINDKMVPLIISYFNAVKNFQYQYYNGSLLF